METILASFIILLFIIFFVRFILKLLLTFIFVMFTLIFFIPQTGSSLSEQLIWLSLTISTLLIFAQPYFSNKKN